VNSPQVVRLFSREKGRFCLALAGRLWSARHQRASGDSGFDRPGESRETVLKSSGLGGVKR